MMTPGIQMLEVAVGIKDLLIAAGFTSLDSLLRSSPAEMPRYSVSSSTSQS